MGDEVALEPAERAQRQPRVAQLAGQQHGVVSHRQLIGLGCSASAIHRMVARGQLHRLHRGVYAVGHRLVSREGRFMAATLATGGVLSHRSAAVLWGIFRHEGAIEVTVATDRRTRGGLRCHCSALPPDERTVHGGIAVTTPPRTLLDLAAVVPEHRLRRAVNQAELLRLADDLSVPDLLDRYPRRRGCRALQGLIATTPTVLRSELESRFLSFTERFGLPRPRMNASRGGYEIDAIYPEQRLIVELDGRDVHSTRSTFEEDRDRDRRLAVQGWRVIRVTHRQLEDRPAEIAADLNELLQVRNATNRLPR